MIVSRLHKILAPLLLSLLLLVTSCASKPPSRFDQAQQTSSQQKSGQAVVKDATQGANFNKFFLKRIAATSVFILRRKKVLPKPS
jgi:hypothetical protein